MLWLLSSFSLSSVLYLRIYRYTSVHPNKNLHKKFMSKSSKIGFAVVQQILGITIGVLSYFACVQPDVKSLKLVYKYILYRNLMRASNLNRSKFKKLMGLEASSSGSMLKTMWSAWYFSEQWSLISHYCKRFV